MKKTRTKHSPAFKAKVVAALREQETVGRRGARPFTLDEMRRLYLREGKLWTVTDEVPDP